jgi:hypothetical protein
MSAGSMKRILSFVFIAILEDFVTELPSWGRNYGSCAARSAIEPRTSPETAATRTAASMDEGLAL